jgi:hypothetical protein
MLLGCAATRGAAKMHEVEDNSRLVVTVVSGQVSNDSGSHANASSLRFWPGKGWNPNTTSCHEHAGEASFSFNGYAASTSHLMSYD